MPAAVRGGSQAKAKPRAKPAPSPGKRPQARRSAPASAPAAFGGGLTLKQGALLGAAIAVVALVGILATGHRAERLVQTVANGVDGGFGHAGVFRRPYRSE